MGPWNKVGWWHAPAICGIESRRGDYATGMGGTKASLSPLDSAGHPPSFGILCVGIERVVGVTAQSPLACHRPSKRHPHLPMASQAGGIEGLTVLDASEVLNPNDQTINVGLATLQFSFHPLFQYCRRGYDLVPFHFSAQNMVKAHMCMCGHSTVRYGSLDTSVELLTFVPTDNSKR